jgi:hypothetical protein
MTAIVIRGRAKATGLTGRASWRATVSDAGRRAVAFAAAAVMAGLVGTVLLQLVTQLLSFPAPVAITGITVLAAALLNSLRRHLHVSTPGSVPPNVRRHSTGRGPTGSRRAGR